MDWLDKFGLQKGFLVPNNHFKLIKEYPEWEHLLDQLHILLEAKNLKPHILQLPTMDLQLLKTDQQWQRAYLLVSFLAQAYVWEDLLNIQQQLPLVLSIPWVKISTELRLKPVISYAAVELFNFDLIDPAGPWDLSNFKVNHTFTNTFDEAWFYLIAIAVESKGCFILPLICKIYHQIGLEQPEKIELVNLLTELSVLIHECTLLLDRMHEHNLPDVFYHQVRPFLTGWENSTHHPNGLFYQGVIVDGGTFSYIDDPNQGSFHMYAGGSAGQSPIIHCLDIALGIRHAPTGSPVGPQPSVYLHEMRKYIPKNAQDFIKHFQEFPNIRDYLEYHPNEVLNKAYNHCIQEMKEFRDLHIRIVTRYIIIPGKRKHHLETTNEDESNPKYEQVKQVQQVDDLDPLVARGTGGTDLVPFLKQMRDETESCMI